MTQEFSLPDETVDQILETLFEKEEQIELPEEMAQRLDLDAETILSSLSDSSLTERIRDRCIASIWFAVPKIVQALLEKSLYGSLPHARFLLDVSGFLSEGRQDAALTDEEDKFDQLSQEELINYIQRALDFAKESFPDTHIP